MSTPISPRHNSSLKHKVPVGKVPVAKKHAQKEEKMTEISPSAGKLFAFTIDANTAQVVKLETLDESGGRHELSEEEKASLAHTVGEGAGLEEFVEKAFEAGIACVLGEDQHQQRADEAAEEAELRHLLLTPLIEHSSVKNLMQREVLNRAILGTLLQRATKKASAAAETEPPPGPQADRAAPARAN